MGWKGERGKNVRLRGASEGTLGRGRDFHPPKPRLSDKVVHREALEQTEKKGWGS